MIIAYVACPALLNAVALLQENIVSALKKEYWRHPDFPTELEGSELQKNASYKERKVLKYYEVTNRFSIFTFYSVFCKVEFYVRMYVCM
jgi:hypothetical protein